jgi:hyperosmotically inducible periplasmic protein
LEICASGPLYLWNTYRIKLTTLNIMNNSIITKKYGSLLALSCVLALGGFAGGCAATATKDSTGEYVDDSTITTKVKSALLGDEAVKSFEIKVETFKGVVQLSGFVDNADQKNAAEKDASAVAGVKDVKDNISVK